MMVQWSIKYYINKYPLFSDNVHIGKMLPYSLVETIRTIRKGTLTAAIVHQICNQRIQNTTILNAYVTNDIPSQYTNVSSSTDTFASTSSPSSASSSLSLEKIPLSIKANICIENVRTTAGSRMLSNYKSPITATVVERLLQNQATINGSTNMDEFGMGSGTYHSYHQPTFNPFSLPWLIPNILRLLRKESDTYGNHDISIPTKLRKRKRNEWLIPGGSSGGAAVSVAVGTALGSIGSDTGGSIRQPASFLGIYGFKPTYGRIPRYGLIPYASSLDTIGILGRTVDDIIHLYSLSQGFDPRDDTSIRNTTTTNTNGSSLNSLPTVLSLLSSLNIHQSNKSNLLSGIRIGIPQEYLPKELNSTTIEFWENTAALLASMGAEIRIVSLPSTPKALSAYYILAPAEAASNLARYDGVRYGYRASDEAVSSTPSSSTTSHNASALLELYARTRSEGFGSEVQRRVLLGNFVLSSEARGQYYDIAIHARNEIRHNFAKIFRSAPCIPMDDIYYSPISRQNIAAVPLADQDQGVDILLTPVSPTLPWHVPMTEEDTVSLTPTDPSVVVTNTSTTTTTTNPTDDYLNDIMTIPASLAHLPAISVPVGSIPYPRTEYDQQIISYLEDYNSSLRQSTSKQNDKNNEENLHRLKETIYEKCRIPIGLQLIGRHSDEYTVLYVAKVLEKLVNYRLPTHITDGINP